MSRLMQLMEKRASAEQARRMRSMLILTWATIGLSGCGREAPTSRVPAGQQANVAKLSAATPDTAPPRNARMMSDQEIGGHVRQQATLPAPPAQ